MGDRGETARYLENWQDEVDSAAEYRAMAAGEPDPRLAKVYANLAAMEEAQAARRTRSASAWPPPTTDATSPTSSGRPDNASTGSKRRSS